VPSLFQISFFEYFGWFAFAASIIFILVQLLLLVDFSHTWAENWIGKYEEAEEGDKKWWYIMLATTFFLYGLSFVGTILMGVFFCHDLSNCSKNVAFLTLNAVLCFLLSAASIHPKVQDASPRSGLLQASIVTAYCTYLVYSAMMSDTDQCNPFQSGGSASQVSVLIGAIFTIIAVCYTTVRAANFVGTVNDSEETEPLRKEENGDADDKKETDTKSEQETADPDEPVPYHFSRFHAIFALGALYLAMLMTDWHTVYDVGTPAASIDSGLAAVWVKVVSSWICVALYCWTLAGPVLLPDRDWS